MICEGPLSTGMLHRLCLGRPLTPADKPSTRVRPLCFSDYCSAMILVHQALKAVPVGFIMQRLSESDACDFCCDHVDCKDSNTWGT